MLQYAHLKVHKIIENAYLNVQKALNLHKRKCRGTGKTTLTLQWLKQQDLPATKAAYFSLDDLYFTNHSVKETIAQFHKQGGKILVLDEVHKYKNWSTEIKNSYDVYTGIKIIFTGSSIIDISRQEGDLSRRAIIYELPGLSYREVLSLKYNLQHLVNKRLISKIGIFM